MKSRTPFFVIFIGIVILCVLALRSVIFEPFKIPSGSMLPGLMTGDFIFASKFAYGLRVPFSDTWITGPRTPKICDIVIFEGPEAFESTLFIKRVIAVPGDTIASVGKNFILNGQPLVKEELSSEEKHTLVQARGFDPEDRYDEKTLHVFREHLGDKTYLILEDDRFAPKKDVAPFTLQPGDFFVAGDNRDDTKDSRDFGPVPMKNLRGMGLVIWLSYRVSFKDSNWFFNWDRVGKSLR